MQNLIIEVKSRFEQALEAKNSWGKNEVKSLFDKILIEVLSQNSLQQRNNHEHISS